MTGASEPIASIELALNHPMKTGVVGSSFEWQPNLQTPGREVPERREGNRVRSILGLSHVIYARLS